MIKLKELSKPKNLAVIAMLAAANVVVSSMLSIHTETIKLSFSFITVAFAAYFFGPVAAAFVGGVGDIVSAVAFPVGAYFPGFTLTAILTGMCFGFFLYNKTNFLKIAISVIINEGVGSLLMNTFWISFLYKTPFGALFVSRLTTQILPMIAVEILTLWLLFGKSMVMEKIKNSLENRK